MTKRVLAWGAAAALFAGSLGGTALLAGAADARISPAQCATQSGQTPTGQQPVCKGGGLTQQPATNPAGKAPPGQQP